MSTEQEPTQGAEPRREPPTREPAVQERAAAQEELPVRQPEEQPSGSAEQEPGPVEQEPTGAGDRRAADVAELQDRWHRALADLDNLRKRHAKELQHARADERARTAAALLPVIDNLELALEHAGSEPSAVLKGVEAVRDQAVETFGGLGYPRFEETGVPFDPARHEVVGTVDTADGAETEPNTVVQVVRPGYGAGEDLLRPASVVVSKRWE
ncbi:nucleotide exchange factor GrpE [Streptomyces sp. TS71-3]|uniref:nucleotide exchange factor GrpE n=1 Tax=Streptomyces sp. TS71-3 TaxID=2733862 RepID=UPI001B18D3D9|nr:nucleotide exchange factor GrpE [Streptomyces sp. TS71-3]GHJ42573.1 protein GrpE [Streptomyces sp. TS71-3]